MGEYGSGTMSQLRKRVSTNLEVIPSLGDFQESLALVKNPHLHERSKHINMWRGKLNLYRMSHFFKRKIQLSLNKLQVTSITSVVDMLERFSQSVQ